MKFLLLTFALSIINFANSADALDARDVVITISSQSNAYHVALAENLKNEILKQASKLDKKLPIIHLSHIDFPHVGGWTILPLMPRLSQLHKQNSSWFFFAEDRTKVKLDKLIAVLGKYDHNKDVWVGQAMSDQEPTIIHHFAFSDNPGKFKYPNTVSGFAISQSLMRSLSNRWRERISSSDFSIDYSFELALFIWNDNDGPLLQNDPAFCTSERPHCATFVRSFDTCKELVARESIYFAVKTCKKFHGNRVTVVKNTWGNQTSRIEYFSDFEDKSIPTVTLGIDNTEHGHCEKTMAIIKHVAARILPISEVKWIVVADDDTILSVARLQRVLSCYDSATSVALGERYGYNIYDKRGYNYITGGGGMVFSRVLLETLAAPGTCDCPSISSPDDMYLGICMARLGVEITHVPFFHQARPVDYAPEYLQNQPVVSFHKHWMIDPLSVYNKWFLESDAANQHHRRVNEHSEL